MIIVYAILVTYVFMSIIMVSANMEKYPYYKKVYKTLPEMKFIHEFDVLHIEYDILRDGDFVWYIDDNDFILNEDVYLFESTFKVFDLYTWYWLCKYRRWFAENVYIDKLK